MTHDKNWTNHVLDFWFDEVGPARWFESDAALDDETRTRFSALYQQLKSNPPASDSDAETVLAAVILFDQFPRNMFRKHAEAFATDAQALALAKQAIAAGLDKTMSDSERMFLYMPFQHAESIADQQESIRLFTALGMEDTLKYAIEHLEIIKRFGRFPHRNAALGRQSSAEEQAFMQSHQGFGQ